MNFRFLEKINNEKKIFYTFLIVHLIVWSCIGLIRTVLPTDSLEGIYWGSLQDWGTPKHPPLAGWITYLTYLPFKIDYSIYFISQAFIIAGFLYIYRLAKFFLDENRAMLSVIILEGCWAYSYITGYYGFNPDIILLFTLPAIAYYFYKCMHFENKKDWLKLGLIVGLSFLNKYQTGMLILPMLIWVFYFKRQFFKNIFFYLSILITLLIFSPHILWLIKYDFFPFLYFNGELTARSWYNHITAPLIFVIVQLAVTIGTLTIFFILKKKEKSPFKLIKNYDKKDFWFVILLGLLPNIIHFLMGLFEGGTMRPRWGFEFWFMLGIMLFYLFPIKIEAKQFKLTTKLSYIAMLIVFLSLGTLLVVEKNYRSRYPVAKVYGDMQTAWAQRYNTPIKYVGGYLEWSIPLTIYGNNHPKTILDTFGYKNPWIDENDLKKSGALIISRRYNEVIGYTKISCPYLSKDFVIKPIEYKFNVYNALNMPREYTIYYFIVPPIK